jgi:predicted Zn-dependent protease
MLFLAGSTGCAVTDRQVIDNAEQMHGSLQPAIMRDQQLANYLQSVGERIVAAGRDADRQNKGPKQHFDKSQNDQWMYSDQMQFHLVNSKTLNAFTTGGEHMYIYNQLFQECKTEDELAAVMAHEYAHVYCRHVAQGMKNQMTTLIAGALVGGAAGYALGDKDNRLGAVGTGAAVGAAGGQFLNMGFTRHDENEADEWGFYFYTRAGWDPNHFADFFQHMIDKGLDKTPEMLSDHPSLANRVTDTRKRVKNLGADADRWRKRPIADGSAFRDLQSRAASLAKKLPDDKSLQNSQQLAQALPRSCVAPVDPPDAQQARQDLAAKANARQAKKKK